MRAINIIMKGLSDENKFKLNFEGYKGTNQVQRIGRALQAEGTVSAKALGLERRRMVGNSQITEGLQVTVKLLDFIPKNTEVKKRF